MTQDSVIRPDGPKRVILMDAPPGLSGLFFKMAGLSLVRPVTLPPKASLENLSMVQPGAAVDQDRVHAFRQVCGYDTGKGSVPSAYYPVHVHRDHVTVYLLALFFPSALWA